MAIRLKPLLPQCGWIRIVVLQAHSSALPYSLKCRHIKHLQHQQQQQSMCLGSVFSLSSSSIRLYSSESVQSPSVDRRSISSSSSSNLAPDATGEHEILVKRFDGLPVLSIPMPSRQEKCRFVLRPLANNLNDFISFIKLEDAAVERVSAYTEDGQVVPGLTSVDVLLKNNFYLQINNERFFVRAPVPEEMETYSHRVEDLSNVKDTVARLFRALNSDQLHTTHQRQLLARLEQVKLELEPMEKVRQELHVRAAKRTRALSWVGLGLMGLQFGFLARLTWWEYSWDIMEPVTYFVTYGTAMGMYAYHLLTLQDYAYPDAHDRQVVMTLHNMAKQKKAFDVSKYNRLRTEKVSLESDLDRLRLPLQVKLDPPHLGRQTTTP